MLPRAAMVATAAAANARIMAVSNSLMRNAGWDARKERLDLMQWREA